MKRIILSLTLLLAICLVGHAQKGNNQVNIGPEVDLPVGTFGDAYKAGFGVTAKGLYGVGKSGQITFTTGFQSLKGKSGTVDGYSYSGQTISIIPYLAGYRQNFKSLYVEPQLGFATYKTKVPDFHFSETRLTYGIGVGYSMKVVDLGLRYQSHEGYSMVALRAAYNINL